MNTLSDTEFHELLRDIKYDIRREADEVLTKINSKIEGIWRDLLNPGDVRSVLLELHLLPNGNLRACVVRVSSGDQTADNAAKKGAMLSSPFREISQFYGGVYYLRFFKLVEAKIHS